MIMEQEQSTLPHPQQLFLTTLIIIVQNGYVNVENLSNFTKGSIARVLIVTFWKSTLQQNDDNHVLQESTMNINYKLQL